jgi:hypothetical protein
MQGNFRRECAQSQSKSNQVWIKEKVVLLADEIMPNPTTLKHKVKLCHQTICEDFKGKIYIVSKMPIDQASSLKLLYCSSCYHSRIIQT